MATTENTYDFTSTPISFALWSEAWAQLDDADLVYGVACDVASGYTFQEAMRAAMQLRTERLYVPDLS